MFRGAEGREEQKAEATSVMVATWKGIGAHSAAFHGIFTTGCSCQVWMLPTLVLFSVTYGWQALCTEEIGAKGTVSKR